MIEAPCLDCGAPVRIDMQDGKIRRTEPDNLAAYTSVPFSKWFKDLPYS
ncbi:MAG: hypothetical protein ABFD62_13585 [Syntrophaceae bacterium]